MCILYMQGKGERAREKERERETARQRERGREGGREKWERARVGAEKSVSLCNVSQALIYIHTPRKESNHNPSWILRCRLRW